MKLQVDPLVKAAIQDALEYWSIEADDATLSERLADALKLALQFIERSPLRGRRLEGLPAHYRRLGLSEQFPPYYFCYRINNREERVLIYLMRHGIRNPYAASTHRKKAAEAQKRVRRKENQELGRY